MRTIRIRIVLPRNRSIVEALIVCLCRRISDRDIVRAARGGCASFEQLQAELGVAGGCGTCAQCAAEVFERARAALLTEAAIAAAAQPAPIATARAG